MFCDILNCFAGYRTIEDQIKPIINITSSETHVQENPGSFGRRKLDVNTTKQY